MAVFMVFELKGGWIRGLGRIYFKTVPSKGQLVKIPMEGDEARSYQILEIDPATDATSVGDIVLVFKPWLISRNPPDCRAQAMTLDGLTAILISSK